jgi:hypothetical protein
VYINRLRVSEKRVWKVMYGAGKVKVKQIHYRPLQALRFQKFEAPKF